ncbi:unnamed protein product [Gongylonema pulchrum]|uniref:ArgoL2 domain-containing protein n=1 Tax=Gongylonema pulchrum TaxID=637853 RepID=A0A183DE59_9BILA|nr:unnamed protein product [Gongylonema pulchrum]
MELLTVAAKPQKVKRELDESQKAKLIRGAAMEPKLRKERIELILNDQDLDNDVFLKNYNVKVEPDMIHLNGRVLDAPKLELFVSSSFAASFFTRFLFLCLCFCLYRLFISRSTCMCWPLSPKWTSLPT